MKQQTVDKMRQAKELIDELVKGYDATQISNTEESPIVAHQRKGFLRFAPLVSLIGNAYFVGSLLQHATPRFLSAIVSPRAKASAEFGPWR